MINLIPTEQKRKMAKEFYFRVIILFLITLSVCIFIAIISILPSYVIISIKEKSALEKLAYQNSQPLPEVDQETMQEVKNLNAKLSTIEKAEKINFLLSDRVVLPILTRKLSDLEITEITYQNDPAKGKMISIRGSAPNRERLLLFRRSFENDSLFTKVDLPISNFVKGSNIEFYLNLFPSSK